MLIYADKIIFVRVVRSAKMATLLHKTFREFRTQLRDSVAKDVMEPLNSSLEHLGDLFAPVVAMEASYQQLQETHQQLQENQQQLQENQQQQQENQQQQQENQQQQQKTHQQLLDIFLEVKQEHKVAQQEANSKRALAMAMLSDAASLSRVVYVEWKGMYDVLSKQFEDKQAALAQGVPIQFYFCFPLSSS